MDKMTELKIENLYTKYHYKDNITDDDLVLIISEAIDIGKKLGHSEARKVVEKSFNKYNDKQNELLERIKF